MSIWNTILMKNQQRISYLPLRSRICLVKAQLPLMNSWLIRFIKQPKKDWLKLHQKRKRPEKNYKKKSLMKKLKMLKNKNNQSIRDRSFLIRKMFHRNWTKTQNNPLQLKRNKTPDRKQLWVLKRPQKNHLLQNQQKVEKYLLIYRRHLIIRLEIDAESASKKEMNSNVVKMQFMKNVKTARN